MGVSIELFLARKNNTQFPIYQYKVVIETYPCPKKIDLPLPAGSISAIWNGKTILEETPLGGGCSPHVPKVAIKVGTYCQESLLVYKPHELSTIDIYIYIIGRYIPKKSNSSPSHVDNNSATWLYGYMLDLWGNYSFT